jgi:hypothetical protein
MKFILLVHHDETAFEQMSDETKKGLLTESIGLCHQLDAKGEYVHASPVHPAAHGDPRAGAGRAFAGDRWPLHRNAGADGGLFSDRGERSR